MLQVLFQNEKVVDQLTRDLLVKQPFEKLLSIAEERICAMLGCSNCYILWNSDTVTRDWKKGYYYFVFSSQPDGERLKTNWLTISNEYGHHEQFYHYPIIQGQKWYGSILIFIKRRKYRISLFNSLLEHISRLLLFQFQHIMEAELTEEKVKEELQKKVARDMHDGVAQKLFFLSAQLYSITKEMSPRATADEISRLERLSDSVQESLVHVRNYMYHLYDCQWQGDLHHQLKKTLDEKRGTGNIDIHFQMNGTVVNECIEVLKTIYHVVDEATNNTIKHAKATKISVVIDVTPIQWSVKIADNGIGLSQARKTKGRMGLVSMEERIKRVGGFLSIRSNKSGTDIVAIIPREIMRKGGE